MKSNVLKSSVLPPLHPMTKLMGYNTTPQVTLLEYKELRDLQAHPDKLPYYEKLIYQREHTPY